MTSSIPDEVRRYLLASVPSVPYLEALLLLRSERARSWDATQLARRLYIPESRAAELLRELAAAGVVALADAHWAYAPADAALAALLDKLAGAYAGQLVEVTQVIHSRVDRRAQQFADAFRWKKEDR